jgi:hypothetical protein
MQYNKAMQNAASIGPKEVMMMSALHDRIAPYRREAEGIKSLKRQLG